MARTIEAVYENGVFKPLQPVKLEEGQVVQLYLPSERRPRVATPEEVEEMMRLARKVYEGLTDAEIAEVEACFTRRTSSSDTTREEKRL
jgi:predicted DNA-binding antitoxin AbrB/MazE fold protein